MKPLDCLDLYADAEFYDAEFQHRDREIPFYSWLCGTRSGPVLEVACGTGRLMIPLAELGHEILGIDASASMIELARRKAPQLEYLVQDCRVMKVNRQFGTIFIATNALRHLHGASDIGLFLERARDHLTSAGTLVLDVFNPDVEKLSRPFSQRYLHKKFTWKGETVEVYAQSEYRKNSKILHFDLSYCRGGQSSRPSRSICGVFFRTN